MIMLNVELKIGTTTHFIHIMVCRIHASAATGRPSFWLFFCVFSSCAKKMTVDRVLSLFSSIRGFAVAHCYYYPAGSCYDASFACPTHVYIANK